MKVIAFLSVICVLMVCAAPALADGVNYGLRVLADNDSDAAQAQKRKVRDAVLDVLWPRFSACSTDAERAQLITDFLPEALSIAQSAGEARVCIADAPYGEPCDTLTITLGAGAGHNWFGILCPEIMEGLSEGEGDGLSWRAQDIMKLWLLYDPPVAP